MKNNYYTIWRCFNQFFLRLDVKPRTWEDRLVLFVGFLIQNNRKSSTIHSYISAIRAVLFNGGIKIKDNSILLSALTRVCKLRNDKLNIKLPIRHDLLCVLISTVPKLFKSPQPYLVIMHQALLSTIYYGLFRIGELTQSQHVVKAANVHIGENKNKMRFMLLTSKTHSLGDTPQVIKISSNKKQPKEKATRWSRICPFKLLQNYLAHRKRYMRDDEQFFIFSDHSPVHPRHLRNILLKLLIVNKIDFTLYSVHAFHAGRSCDLLDMGVSVETIHKLGRWKSSAIYKYLKY